MKTFGIIKKFNNEGMAIVMFMASMGICMVLIASILSLNDNLTLLISNNSVREESLHISEAGYNRFLWCLNDDSYFYKKGINQSLGFEPEDYYTVSDNPLWKDLPKNYKQIEYKKGGKTVGYFKISVIPPTVQNPELTVSSVGWLINKENFKRTIKVKIFKKKFCNFVDFSNDMKTASGSNVYWGTGEQIKGPLFTNGTLRTSGVPVFHDEAHYVVGTSFSGGPPSFLLANQPEQKSALVFPSSNSQLVFWGNPSNGGYSYTGRTSILLNASAGDDNEVSNTALIIKNKNTGDIAQTLPIPPSKVIYVNGDVFISGILDGKLTIFSEGSIYLCGKDPTNFIAASAANKGGITYANQSIPKTRNEVYGNPCNDMLGLVAKTKVVVNTKKWPDDSAGGINNSAVATDVTINNINIQCALFGLGGTAFYGVDDYAGLGDKGYIYLLGSKISSRMAATYSPSGASINGYREDNTFDYRMLFDSPPHFLEPTNSGWEVRGWQEGNI